MADLIEWPPVVTEFQQVVLNKVNEAMQNLSLPILEKEEVGGLPNYSLKATSPFEGMLGFGVALRPESPEIIWIAPTVFIRNRELEQFYSRAIDRRSPSNQIAWSFKVALGIMSGRNDREWMFNQTEQNTLSSKIAEISDIVTRFGLPLVSKCTSLEVLSTYMNQWQGFNDCPVRIPLILFLQGNLENAQNCLEDGYKKQLVTSETYSRVLEIFERNDERAPGR